MCNKPGEKTLQRKRFYKRDSIISVYENTIDACPVPVLYC